jgi:hypothetical protein
VADLLDRFRISDVDDAGDTKYFGNLAMNGEWYILREDSVAKTFRYARGQGNYGTAVTGAWATRAALSYDYFDVVF